MTADVVVAAIVRELQLSRHDLTAQAIDAEQRGIDGMAAFYRGEVSGIHHAQLIAERVLREAERAGLLK